MSSPRGNLFEPSSYFISGPQHYAAPSGRGQVLATATAGLLLQVASLPHAPSGLSAAVEEEEKSERERERERERDRQQCSEKPPSLDVRNLTTVLFSTAPFKADSKKRRSRTKTT